MDTLFTFIRNHNKKPVGCIAYQIDLVNGKLEYEMSAHNPIDHYNRNLAKSIAEGRLNKHPRTFAFNPTNLTSSPQVLRALAKELVKSYDGVWKMNKGGLSKRVFRALTDYLNAAEIREKTEETKKA